MTELPIATTGGARRLSRKRFLSLLALSIFCCLFAVAACGLFLRPRLRAENYQLICKGLSQAAVEKLLGGPPGNYGWFRGGTVIQSAEGFRARGVRREWCDDRNKIEICFDVQGRVIAHHKRAHFRQKPTGLKAKLWAMGWRIRRYVTGEQPTLDEFF